MMYCSAYKIEFDSMYPIIVDNIKKTHKSDLIKYDICSKPYIKLMNNLLVIIEPIEEFRLELDFIKSLSTNTYNFLKSPFIEETFENIYFSYLYQKFIQPKLFEIIKYFIDSPTSDFLKLLVILREISIYNNARQIYLRLASRGHQPTIIFCYNDLSWFTGLQHFIKTKTLQIKIILLSGDIIGSIEPSPELFITDLFKYLHILFNNFSLVVDDNVYEMHLYTYEYVLDREDISLDTIQNSNITLVLAS